MTISLRSVHYESSASYLFNSRSLDVSPAVSLSGRCWLVSCLTVMAVWLLIVTTVLTGAGGAFVLKKSVVSCCLSAFCVHVQRSPEACVENALENDWFPPLPAFSSPVIHSFCFPHLRLCTRKLFFSSFPPALYPRRLPPLPSCLLFPFFFSPVVVNVYTSPFSFSEHFSTSPNYNLLLPPSHPAVLSTT